MAVMITGVYGEHRSVTLQQRHLGVIDDGHDNIDLISHRSRRVLAPGMVPDRGTTTLTTSLTTTQTSTKIDSDSTEVASSPKYQQPCFHEECVKLCLYSTNHELTYAMSCKLAFKFQFNRPLPAILTIKMEPCAMPFLIGVSVTAI